MSEKKKNSAFINILCNIVIPAFVMIKLSKPQYFGPLYGLLIALAFPIGYGIYDFIRNKDVNFISLLGFASVLLTGVFGLFELPPLWIAVKEASVPLIIAVFIIATVSSRHSIINKMFYNEMIMQVDAIDQVVIERNLQERFAALFKKVSYWFAGSFLLSSFLNFSLAWILLKSEPGTSAYTEELGRMTALSFPVIALPCTIIMFIILFYLIKQISKLTDLPMEAIFNKK